MHDCDPDCDCDGLAVVACVVVLVCVRPPDTVIEGDKLAVSETDGDTVGDRLPVKLLLWVCEKVATPEVVDEALDDEACVIDRVALGVGLCVIVGVGAKVPVNEELAVAPWLSVGVGERVGASEPVDDELSVKAWLDEEETLVVDACDKDAVAT